MGGAMKIPSHPHKKKRKKSSHNIDFWGKEILNPLPLALNRYSERPRDKGLNLFVLFVLWSYFESFDINICQFKLLGNMNLSDIIIYTSGTLGM